MKQTVRIIGGKHRGKKVSFPDTSGLRPTPSRVRETLFNWLMHHVQGADCLDAFAGSGALGFEAYSRGAHEVTLLEKTQSIFSHLKHQISTFKTESVHPIKIDTLSYLQHSHKSFDIIFLDPPFNGLNLLDHCIRAIEEREILKPRGLLYIESAHPIILNDAYWETLKAKKAGLVHYALHQKRDA
ncbi:MAG: 16S rRNA (guanine(966)-N(2))-methyltransferase RsmD [Legionellaceae bacterium]|nr:16S rRNA (guanine(966)-N(2))-methyltransferase RsmD [Legionellaceae bacterium]